MRGLLNDAYAIFVSDCRYKSLCSGYSSELPQLVKAIQMSPHIECFYKVETNIWAVI